MPSDAKIAEISADLAKADDLRLQFGDSGQKVLCAHMERNLKKNISKVELVILCLSVLLLLSPAILFAAPAQAPVEGMVTMVDLGAGECVPCKLMAPILVKMEKVYSGKAAVVFLDVWKAPAPARRFGIRYIPTQIFFDKKGKEVYRHEGFMSEEEIVRQFRNMGIKLGG